MADSTDKKKILILEDDSFSQKIYISRLNKENYAVTGTPSAVEVIRLAKKIKPDLFIVDMMVQDGNGFDVVKELRGLKEFKKTPIIALSNLGQEDDIVRAAKAGIDKYFVKSNTRFQEVLEEINKLIKK